jgi:transposase
VSQGRKRRKYTAEFKRAAVEKLRTCRNVSGLARELGIRRKFLYQWRKEAEAPAEVVRPREANVEEQLRTSKQQIAELQRVLGKKQMEVDFFRGAFERVKELRQKRNASGEAASTPRSRV